MEGTSVAAAGYQQLPIDKIQPSPYQARKDFNPEELQGLADSMKEEGLIQPIVVRRMSEGAWGLEGDGGSGTIHEKEAPSAPMLPPSPALMYELISGERRLRAAKLLGWPTIEAKIIQTISEAGAAAKGLVENLQRKDLNPIEEAEGFSRLNQLDPDYWTQEKIGKVTGKTQGYISQSFNLLKLPTIVRESISRLILSRSHGLELLRLITSDDQILAAKTIVSKGLSRDQARKLVDQMLGSTLSPNPLPKGEGGGSPGEAADPLAGAWPPLQANLDLTPDVHWEVKYGPHKLGGGYTMNGWFFFVMPSPASNPQSALATWFTQIGQALQGAKVEAVLPETAVQMQKAEQGLVDNFKPRLPANAEEEKELEEIAAKAGPKGVYTWIYGADSLMTKAVPAATWGELGITDPAAGLAQILDGIKKFQGATVDSQQSSG